MRESVCRRKGRMGLPAHRREALGERERMQRGFVGEE